MENTTKKRYKAWIKRKIFYDEITQRFEESIDDLDKIDATAWELCQLTESYISVSDVYNTRLEIYEDLKELGKKYG